MVRAENQGNEYAFLTDDRDNAVRTSLDGLVKGSG